MYTSSYLNLIFKALYTVFINPDKVKFPKSSILGIVVSFRGGTGDFPDTRLTDISPDSYIRFVNKYMHRNPGSLHR